MKIIKNDSDKFSIKIVACLVLFFSIIEINSPIVAYGSQIFGLVILVVFRMILLPKINVSRIILLFSLFLFVNLITYVQSSYLNHTGILWLNTERTLLWMSIAILFYDYFLKLSLQSLSKILNLIIIVSSVCVFIQVVSYYIFQYQLDLSIILGGEGVRSSFDLAGISYRPTGLTSEPAIHSGIMFGLLTLQYLLDKKSGMSAWLGLVSICLTFSTLGILLVFIYVVILYTKKLRYLLFGIIVFSLLAIYLSEHLIARYESFVDGADSSNLVKLLVFEEFLSDIRIISLGFGFIGMDGTSPIFYEALYDMTFFFNHFIYYGVYIGSILCLLSIYLLYVKSCFTLREKLLISTALIKLSGPTFLFLNFFIMLILVINKKEKLKLIKVTR